MSLACPKCSSAVALPPDISVRRVLCAACGYQNGRGVEKDYTTAVKCFGKSAEQGNSFAQNDLGVMYENAWGVEGDLMEAVKWYRRAAAQGNAEAKSNLDRLNLH